jgi:hypothetical protein
MPENMALSDTELNGRKEQRKEKKNVLTNKMTKGLEDIDFEEEERLEREAIEAERSARQNRSQKVQAEHPEAAEEPLVVERVKKKKKKKKDVSAGGSKTKKKDKGGVEV